MPGGIKVDLTGETFPESYCTLTNIIPCLSDDTHILLLLSAGFLFLFFCILHDRQAPYHVLVISPISVSYILMSLTFHSSPLKAHH